MAGMYLGPSSSAFSGAFGGAGGSVGPVNSRQFSGGGTPPSGGPIGPVKNPRGPFTDGGGVTGGKSSFLPPSPFKPILGGTPVPAKNLPSSAVPAPGTSLSAQAVRASGPTQGFDASYLQNLATAIGGLFNGGKQTGNTTSFNPLGNLGEISPNANMEGNAPQQGLPQTWLQQALNGLGFSWTAPTANPITPTLPKIGGTNGDGGGIRGPRMAE